MLEVELIGDGGPGAPVPAEVERLLALAFASAGVDAGHVAVSYVDTAEIARLNARFRGRDDATDVLSFPVDGAGDAGGPPGARELGDIVICPPQTADLREAIVHGALHLTGMDHEADDGEMLALQAELLQW